MEAEMYTNVYMLIARKVMFKAGEHDCVWEKFLSSVNYRGKKLGD